MSGLMVVMLISIHVCGVWFKFCGQLTYSKEWVRKLKTKSMLHCFRRVKCQQGDTP